MNILLVNNDSDTWQELQRTVSDAGHNVTSIHHKEISLFPIEEYELAILSGGWWYDDEIELLAEYAEELELIRTCPIPLLGICIGMQLMHVSLDRAAPLLDVPQSGIREITVTELGQLRYALPPTMSVFKNHTRGVIEADPIFDVLAYSPGHVEIIAHQERPMLGVQFHPEVGDAHECVTLLNTLINLVVPSPNATIEGKL